MSDGMFNLCYSQSLAGDTQEFVLGRHMDSINQLFGGQTVEQIRDNLEADGSDWAVKQLNIIRIMVS